MKNDPSDPVARFEREVAERIAANGQNTALSAASAAWVELADAAGYEYNFSWMGRPIIQYPQDIVAMQELMWRTRPDLVIETGIAHGGSTVFYASMLALLGGPRRVVSVDIDIRAHNRAAIEAHPMFLADRITLIQGSSIDPAIVAQVTALAAGKPGILLCLDSNHTHDHVLAELRAYAPLVRKGHYIVVFDTSIETIEAGGYPDRPWGKGNNPKTAVAAFLRESRRFVVDRRIADKLLVTSAPDGFLLCVEDPA
jgi:cephalosporin hydroxylase